MNTLYNSSEISESVGLSFTRYCKIRLPGLIGISMTLWVFISLLHPDKIGLWFTSLTEVSQWTIRFAVLGISGVFLFIYGQAVDRYCCYKHNDQ